VPTEIVRDPIIALSTSLAAKAVYDNPVVGPIYNYVATLMRTPDGKYFIVHEGTCMERDPDWNGEDRRPKRQPYHGKPEYVTEERVAEIMASSAWTKMGGGDSAV
jgi:hypothetical protein